VKTMNEDQQEWLSDSIVFPLGKLDRGILDLILPDMSPPTKWSAVHAVKHLNRAWKIRELDPEMALFRSLTAEEEAATALMLSLKRRRYAGADRLNHRDHVQKNAVFPFLQGVQRVIGKLGPHAPPTSLVLDGDTKPHLLKIRFTVPHPGDGTPLWASPEPPLHFSTKSSLGETPMKLDDFKLGLDELAAASGAATIIDYIRERANLRNRILYAAPGGIPQVGGDIEKGLAQHQGRTFAILKAYCLVDPYPQTQGFVQQCLYAFLKRLDRLPDDIDF